MRIFFKDINLIHLSEFTGSIIIIIFILVRFRTIAWFMKLSTYEEIPSFQWDIMHQWIWYRTYDSGVLSRDVSVHSL